MVDPRLEAVLIADRATGKFQDRREKSSGATRSTAG